MLSCTGKRGRWWPSLGLFVMFPLHSSSTWLGTSLLLRVCLSGPVCPGYLPPVPGWDAPLRVIWGKQQQHAGKYQEANQWRHFNATFWGFLLFFSRCVYCSHTTGHACVWFFFCEIAVFTALIVQKVERWCSWLSRGAGSLHLKSICCLSLPSRMLTCYRYGLECHATLTK